MKKNPQRWLQPSSAWKYRLKTGLRALVIVAAMNGRANAQSIKMDITGSNLAAVVANLQKQAPGYQFSFQQQVLEKVKVDKMNLHQPSVKAALEYLQKNYGVQFLMEGNMVSVKYAPATGAQEKQLFHGKVTDESNAALPGVSIMDQHGKMLGTTDASGVFAVKTERGVTLTFTYLGFAASRYTVAGAENVISIVMKQNSKELNGVVVTALGISREQKSLGYATQKLDGGAVSNAPTNGFANALSGKVAGLNITKAGGPMGSSRIVLRGESILGSGGGEAIIVVDGVIVNNSFNGTGHQGYLGNDSPIDFGSALTDINPEDIETINVLKGPGAAALYGSRGAGGAIIITTKSGSRNVKGLGVTVSSNIAFDNVNHWPDYQYEYGQGTNNAKYYSYGQTADGPNTSSTSSSWGPKFDGQSYFQYNSPKDANGVRTERTPWVPYKNNRKDFFRTGMTFTNTVSIAGSNDKGDMRLSFTHMKNDWIMPNTGYKRYTISFAGNTQVSKKISLSTKIDYTNKDAGNLPNSGYNNQSIAYFINFQNPNVNLDWYKPYWKPGREGIEQNHPFSSLIDNPYLIVNEMINASMRHNLTGNVMAKYKILDNLELSLRSGLDFGYEFRNQRRPKNTQKFQDGMYRQQTVMNYENNNDFLLRYNKQINADFNIIASLGGNVRNQRRYYTNQRADKLAAVGVYNLTNSKDPVQSSSERPAAQVNSLYAFLNTSWRNKIFLDLTIRRDQSSTLPEHNNTFYYPSVVASAILSDMVNMPSLVSFAKLRASYASVGYDAALGTYSLEKDYVSGSITGSMSNGNVLPNPDLKPRRNNALEFGTEWRLFKNRAGIDVTYYTQRTINQIASIPIDRSTGYDYQLANVGIVENNGVEVVLNVTPVQQKNFEWKTSVNWALNRNKVIRLDPKVGSSIILAEGPRGTLEAREGHPLGELYGIGFLRSPDGQIVFKNGLAQMASDATYRGNANPDWRGGLNNQFTYKNLSLSILLDMRKGGKIYSLTHAILAEQGKIKETLPGRDNGLIGQGVKLDENGKYVPNDVLVTNMDLYYNAMFDRSNVEANTFDASYVKLREVVLSYKIPASLFGRSFIKGAAVSLYGRDLFVWSDFPAFDPETATLNSNSIVPGFETGQFPSTRTIGANVKLNF
ncbi:MAG TPA: SusC/RagA family TonB-linked outer membrane protein [Chitinophaga sp.]|uniref:SusC/RagA family TonB-linked outer membrane protein n=1 Tax=Chitinophaga sp. TaxID=1869181 RepID=UPI002C24EA46|nr:SusC/RagA family TonB-linked outer membrane protein [Chitinophaga sp.]HVI45262.1 SusC/RagA family TonB-linked outer membrane protein [Chitinophaga sp.]